MLRQKGLAAAAKKGGRAAEEGLVGVAESRRAVSLVEINCETDFVARNDKFCRLMGNVAQSVLAADAASIDPHTHQLLPHAAEALKISSGENMLDAVAEVAGTVRENVQFRRAFRLETQGGVLVSYLHTSPAPGLGRIGAVLALEAEDGSTLEGEAAEKVASLGKKIAMHIAAVRPLFLDRSSVSKDVLEVEKKLLTEQAAASGKPPAIIEKMVMGRLSKYYEEFCLMEQKFVMDDSLKVAAVVKQAGIELGKSLKVAGYVRAEVGEASSP